LSPAIWAAPQKVYFAGFAFLSNYSDIKHEYPYSKVVAELKENENPLLDKILREKLKNISNPNIEIIINKLGDYKSADALSLALVLDWEDVCVEHLAPELYKIVFNLHGQILVFNFHEMKIIATYPFGVRVNDASKTSPDKTHIQELFERLYLSQIDNINFLDEFVARLKKIKIDEKFNHKLKVAEVMIGEKALKYMPDTVKENQSAYKTFVAQQFSSFLSSNQNVAVLPYTKGYAIGNKMSARFDSGDVFQLEIPKEDISINIVVRGFKKVQMDKNHTGSSWAYGSFIRFKVLYGPDSPIVDAKFKNAAVKIIPSTQIQTTKDKEIRSDWSAFQECLLLLFKNLTLQISERSSSWISKHAKGDNVKQQLKDLDKALKKI
jgi:hypothetical protein